MANCEPASLNKKMKITFLSFIYLVKSLEVLLRYLISAKITPISINGTCLFFDVFTGVKGGIVRFAGQRLLPETLKLAVVRQWPLPKAFAATMVLNMIKQQLDLIVQSYLTQAK